MSQFPFWTLTARLVLGTLRMPVFALISLIQPAIWLFMFGNLFGPLVSLGGSMSSVSAYQATLVPGLTIMAAYFSSAYAGMYALQDAESGMLARQMVAPLRRTNILLGYILHATVLVIMQSAILLAVATFCGFGPKQIGIAMIFLLASTALVGLAFASLSVGLAMFAGRPEPVVGIMNFIGLPMLFLSQALTGTAPVNATMATLTQYNPLNWAVIFASDGYLRGSGDVINVVKLFVFTLGAYALCNLAFRYYLRRQ